MKKSTKTTLGVLGAIALIGPASLSAVYAAETIGTVTGKDGDIQDLYRIQATVTDVDGSEVTFTDPETNTEYTAGFGPSWFTKAYEVGEEIVIEGVATDGDNDHGHTFQVMKVDDTMLRAEFEGRPEWAGQRGGGEGAGLEKGSRHGMGQGGSGFVDADGDGNCDNEVN